jgi:hypothetical protein
MRPNGEAQGYRAFPADVQGIEAVAIAALVRP